MIFDGSVAGGVRVVAVGRLGGLVVLLALAPLYTYERQATRRVFSSLFGQIHSESLTY